MVLNYLPGRIEAMGERGIDISGEYPKPWTDEVLRAADVVVTMGCGDACPVFPGRRYEDWVLDDPAGLDLDDVRPIRDGIERRVRRLLDQIEVPARMFELPAMQLSGHARTGRPLWIGEVVATAGLIAVIVALARTGRAPMPAVAVAAWIGAAYWFTRHFAETDTR